MGDPKRGLPPNMTGDVPFATAGQDRVESSQDRRDHEVVEKLRKNAEEKAVKCKESLLGSEEVKQAEALIGEDKVRKLILNIEEIYIETQFVRELEHSGAFLNQRSEYVGGEGSPFIFETLVEAKSRLAAVKAWQQAWYSGADIGGDCRLVLKQQSNEEVRLGKSSSSLEDFGAGEELEAETWQKKWLVKNANALNLLEEAFHK